MKKVIYQAKEDLNLTVLGAESSKQEILCPHVGSMVGGLNTKTMATVLSALFSKPHNLVSSCIFQGPPDEQSLCRDPE